MAAKSKKIELFPRLIEMNKGGMTIQEACLELGIHPMTASNWFKQDGVAPVRVRTGRREDRTTRATFACEQCSAEFEDYARKQRRFCSLECNNQWQIENRTVFKTCPCGKKIELQEGATTMYSYRKFCSPECRAKYQAKRQADPANWTTKTCRGCAKEFPIRRSSQSVGYYCSNKCAEGHTKTKHHIVIRDGDEVFDSSYEAAVWGMCRALKIPIERFDRQYAVTGEGFSTYGPDFYLPTMRVAIETKGYQDDMDENRWSAYRQQRGPLLVIDQKSLASWGQPLLQALSVLSDMPELLSKK